MSTTTAIDASWALVEGRLVRDATVVLEGDTIAEVRTEPLRGTDVERLRADGQLLLPGFISGHTHVASGSPTRGLIESGRSYLRPLELVEELSDVELDDLTAWNLAELVRGGCTTQVEMSLSLRQAESYVRMARRFGARGFPGPMIPGVERLAAVWFRERDETLFESVPGTLAELEAARAFARATGADDLVRPMVALHATDTQTTETLRAALELSRELGTGLHIHLSQRPGETETVRRLWGKTPAAWLEEAGFGGGEPFFAAHMTALDLEADPAVLRRCGVTYSTCPSANGAGGGTQPWPELLAAGVNTNIGIDTHSNDYVENLKLAVIQGHVRHDALAGWSAVPLRRPSVWDAVAAATVNAANGLGRDDLGRIAPGARADLVAVDVSGLLVGGGAVPPEPLHNLLYAHGRCVRHTITNGRVQVRDGELALADERELAARAGPILERLWARLEEEGWF